MERADRQLVDFAASYNPTELRRLGNRLVDVIAPAVAEADAAAYLHRIEAEAHRTRSLRFHDDHHGNWRFHGQFPIVEGAQLAELIHALAAKGDTTRTNTTDDTALGREERCWSAKCADALLEIIHTYQASGQAPGAGGDRPRINVTIDLATLQGQLGHAVLGNGAPISAGQARRLACDANILPVVLNGPSAPVDVGRDHRLVTGPLRLALNARDQGCCYPGCEKPPTSCEAHHLMPWWAGGSTALDNTALLCRHHHQLVEPNPKQTTRPPMATTPRPPRLAARAPTHLGRPHPNPQTTHPLPELTRVRGSNYACPARHQHDGESTTTAWCLRDSRRPIS